VRADSSREPNGDAYHPEADGGRRNTGSRTVKASPGSPKRDGDPRPPKGIVTLGGKGIAVMNAGIAMDRT